MSIKSFSQLTFLIVSFIALISCNNQAAQNEEAAGAVDNNQVEMEQQWDQLKETYHNAMAGTFHPAEDGDLKPVKAMYGELANTAAAWAAAPIPEKYADKNLNESLTTLVSEAKGIGELVQNQATDEEITQALYSLHDVFHAIKGECEGH
jgi:hypothetical protein